MERSWIKTKMPEEALELKKNLRCDMKARRNALTDEEKTCRSETACQN